MNQSQCGDLPPASPIQVQLLQALLSAADSEWLGRLLLQENRAPSRANLVPVEFTIAVTLKVSIRPPN